MPQEARRTRAAAANSAASTTAGSRTPEAAPSAPAPKQTKEAQRNDYELVLGRGQIASCLFAGTVVVAIFAGGAYFAGKLSAVNCVAASNSIPQASAPVQVASVVTPTVVSSAEASQAPVTAPPNSLSQIAPVQATSKPAPLSAAAISAAPGLDKTTTGGSLHAASVSTAATPLGGSGTSDAKMLPLFADPQRGALYLQLGAVEKGMAMVIAEGLRQHGLPAFVAPGPSERIFRVLVGPYTNENEYKLAKAQVDSIDVTNFGRQYEK